MLYTSIKAEMAKKSAVETIKTSSLKWSAIDKKCLRRYTSLKCSRGEIERDVLSEVGSPSTQT